MMLNAADRDVFLKYDDYHPLPGKSYFYKDTKPPSGFQKITVLIPMYNESTKEFKRTLQDLHACIVEMNKVGAGYVHILAILDGWNATHSSMKEYLKDMFPLVSSEIDEIGNSTKSIETYILQKLSGNEVTSVPIDNEKGLKISVMIKLDNRRKHNSHAWFLETFAQEMESDFTFLTDCGTRFDRKCLINLYRGISNDPNCSAISGRQRVMTTTQQESQDNFRGFMYRSMQRFDYEASLASYVGAFSTFGMLPVIPGPCGLYRFAAICDVKKRKQMRDEFQEVNLDDNDNEVIVKIKAEKQKETYIDAIDFYIKTVSLNPDETGMLLGSLLLAEDRILSYAAVLKTEKRYHTKYEPNACFYFEAETNPTTLLQQRRRWINGTLAGYLWLLQNMHLLYNSKVNPFNKIILTILILSQLMMFCVMFVGTSVLTVAIRFPLVSYFGVPRLYVELMIGGYCLLYVLFVYMHSSPKKNAPKLNTKMFDIVTICNMIIVVVTLYSFVISLMDAQLVISIVIIAFNVFMPFVLAAMHDLKSLVLMFGSFIQYTLLLPTFTITLSVYAFSRLWELTWGNRPSEKLLTIKNKKSKAEMKQIKNKLHRHASFVAWILVALNLGLTVLFSYMQDDRMFIFILQMFIFVWSSLQMIFSFMYFIARMFILSYQFVKRLVIAHSTSRKRMDILQKEVDTKEFSVVVETIKTELYINL
jgi:cellulose synthase/poly-beta-1,6-N-acetylglucosamine synthase-like glycosyltransferase